MFLTPEEVAELTGRQRSDAQLRALRFMGIEHRVRPDGSLAVSRAHVEAILGGVVYAAKKCKKPIQPDFSMVT